MKNILCFLRFIGLFLNLEEDIRLAKEKEVQEMVEINHKTTFHALDLMKNEDFIKALPIFNDQDDMHMRSENHIDFCDDLLNPIGKVSH